MFAELRTVPVTIRILKLELESDGEDVSAIENAYKDKVLTLDVDTTQSAGTLPTDEEIGETLENYISDETSWLVYSVAYVIVPKQKGGQK